PVFDCAIIYLSGGMTMDWITGIQRAIDYIEAHLNDELEPEAIAREAFPRPFTFSVCSAFSAATHWVNIFATAG
ncbi:MAG: hypothetical protein II747_05995, partial [Clostridia bacterium]|nr:hypothetical protein [Clostridia bacterium]